MAAPCVRRWALLIALLSLIVAAAAARQAQQPQQIMAEQQAISTMAAATPATTSISPEQRCLLTYFFNVDNPELQLLPAAQGSGRPGRTPLRVTLPSATAVSTFMPVVSPRSTGMVHEVVNTWNALKNYALMFARVGAINQQAAAGSPRLFPLPGIAVTAAAATASTDIAAVIDAAEARGQRSTWTETSPGSMLLMPAGQSVAAVADIMGITHDAASGAITLDLDIVHEPHMVTEFDEHGKQTLDTQHAHYHLFPPSGVKVDVAGLLRALQASDYKLPGLHVFVKGGCYSNSATLAALTQATIGGETTITARLACAVSGQISNSCYATFTITGDYEFVSASGTFCRQNAPPSTRGPGTGTEVVGVSLNQVATLTIRRLRGVLQVTVTSTSDNLNVISNTLTIGGPVSKLLLAPAKADRHVHERATVTLLALDETGSQGVPGVPITLAATGDCDPSLTTATVTTDATGRAVAHISAKQPGAVAVVAVATSGSGVRLVTPPAHIIFFGDPEYVEEREHDYYGRRDHDAHYDAIEAYGEVQPGADSDAERFAAEATKHALAQLPA